MILKGKGGIQYNLESSPFAQGGEGQIYNIIGQSDKVAKLYKPGKITADHERKLIKMVTAPPDKNVLDQIAWPMDVLYDNGKFVGFVMKKFKLNEELNVIYEYGSSAKYPNLSWGNKINIAKNLCVVLNAVHEAGHVCGDFNPKNISVDPNTGRVTFVDTDSYHITDGSSIYRCNVGMPEYLPREIQVKLHDGLSQAALPTFSKETDNFALAVHIFQLLMNGVHPFACSIIPSADSVVLPDTSDSILKGECPFFKKVSGKQIPKFAPSADILPDEITDLFVNAFIVGHFQPQERPSAETWYYALDKLQKSLKKCKNEAHHEYYDELSDCPWCAADQRFNSAISSPMVQSSYKPVAAPTSYRSGYTPSSASVSGRVGGKSSPYVGSSAPYTGSNFKHKRGFSKKLKKAIIALIIAASVALVTFGIIGYVQVSNVNKLMDKIPQTISDYSRFENQIMDAHTAYNDMWGIYQIFADDSRLESVMNGFNEYRIAAIQQLLSEISVENAKDSDRLERLAKYYKKLTPEQSGMLTAEEFGKLESLNCAYDTIVAIDALMNDVVANYGTLSDINIKYDSLSEELRAYVYNYSKLDGIEDYYNMYSNLVFTEANGGWSVSVKEDGKAKLTGDVVIPEVYQGQPVTTIPEKAFAGCSAVTSFTVPKSVTLIEYAAFSGCIKLQKITLPFVGKSRSATGQPGHFGIIFGKDSYIGGTAAKNSEGYSNFSYYIPGQLKSVTITDGVQLYEQAFQNCSMLTEINLNNEIIAMGNRAFYNCSGIREINISSITIISNSLFAGCTALETLTLNDEVTQIGEYAFSNCMNLKSINSDVDGEFIIRNSVQSIEYAAFSGCIKLQSITLPFVGKSRSATGQPGHFGIIFGKDSYTGSTAAKNSEGYSNFSYYIPAQLKSVTITDAVKLYNQAFQNCSMLKELKINSGAKKNVGSNVFNNCKSPSWF